MLGGGVAAVLVIAVLSHLWRNAEAVTIWCDISAFDVGAQAVRLGEFKVQVRKDSAARRGAAQAVHPAGFGFSPVNLAVVECTRELYAVLV